MIAISIALIFVGFIMLLLKNYFEHKKVSSNKKITSSRKEFFYKILFSENICEYITSILVTFVSVFLAIYFTNSDIHKQEVKKTKDLLQVSLNEVEEVHDIIKRYHLKVYDMDTNYVESFNAIPFHVPMVIEDVIKTDVVIENVSVQTYSAIITCVRYLNTLQERIENEENEEQLYIYVRAINMILTILEESIENEISYINGDITMDEVVNSIKEMNVRIKNDDFEY